MPKKKAKKDKASVFPGACASSSTSSNKFTAAQKPTRDDGDEKSGIPINLLVPLNSNKNKKKQQFPMEEMIPGFLWVVHDFLSEKECQNWIDFVETPAKTTSSKKATSTKLEYVQHPATKYITNRECYRWQQNDDNIADILFQRIQQCGILKEIITKVDFPSSPDYVPSGCNPNIRLYKYEKGMCFGKHIDESNPVKEGQTEITVLIYLSNCQGGSTRFYPQTSSKRTKSIAFAPKIGSLLLHVHGDRCLEHEADAVVQGIKYILRTDIVYSSS